MRFLAFNFALLLLSGILIAQTTTSTRSGSPNPQTSSVNTQTVTGCLSKAGNTYVLLGGPIRQYRITGGDTQALQHKLGHTVRVTGPVGNVESGASPNGVYNPGSTAGAGYSTISARSVKDLYANCSGN